MENVKIGASEGDPNLVEMWVRKEPGRWVAGAVAGIFATVLMLLFAMVICSFGHMDIMAPLKVPAVPFLGAEAMRVGMHTSAIIMGLVALFAFTAFLGAVFAHFTYTNHLPSLLGMGFTWGIFAWIFLNNLMFQSWLQFRALDLPKGPMLFTLVVFGLGLSSVAFFDRVFNSK